MAYEFTAANSRYLISASTPLFVPPLTISAWFYPTASTTGVIASACSATSHYLGLAFISDGSVRAIDSRVSNTVPAPTVSTGVWSHGCAVFASNNSRTQYANAVGTTATDAASGSIGVANFFIAARRLGGVLGTYFTGRVADVGIWNVALTPEEVTSMYKGMTCDKIRPESLIFYAPLVRDLQDVSGGLAITNNNSATVAVHPRVYA